MIISPELSETTPTRFSILAREKLAAGEALISLGLGEPAFESPPAIVEATIEALRHGYTRYCHCLGLPELRDHIALKFKSENGLRISSQDVVVTVGAKQAFLVALQAILRPGDEVINVTPCFLSFIPAIKIAEPQSIIRNIDLDRSSLRFDIEAICTALSPKTRAIILNTPHNPSGAMLSREDIDSLVSHLQKFPDCYIISDEIYEYLAFAGNRHYSIGAWDAVADRVFTINSMSKAFAMTGWRIGYMSVPPKVQKVVASLLQHSNMNVTTFIQKGACRVFSLNRDFLETYCRQLENAANHLHSELSSTSLHMAIPKGGFFSFIDISSTGLTSDEFATELLRSTNVAVNPGIQCGANWDSHIRLSFAGAPSALNAGIERLKTFLNNEVSSGHA